MFLCLYVDLDQAINLIGRALCHKTVKSVHLFVLNCGFLSVPPSLPVAAVHLFVLNCGFLSVPLPPSCCCTSVCTKLWFS